MTLQMSVLLIIFMTIKGRVVKMLSNVSSHGAGITIPLRKKACGRSVAVETKSITKTGLCDSLESVTGLIVLHNFIIMIEQ